MYRHKNSERKLKKQDIMKNTSNEENAKNISSKEDDKAVVELRKYLKDNNRIYVNKPIVFNHPELHKYCKFYPNQSKCNIF